MTCFWNGILSQLSVFEINLAFHTSFQVKPTPADFVNLLKERAVTVSDIWNEEKLLTDNQNNENLEWIKTYITENIYQGHDCSTSDPFLFLIAYLFGINIYHIYNGHLIKYSHINHNANKTIIFSSDNGHFR